MGDGFHGTADYIQTLRSQKQCGGSRIRGSNIQSFCTRNTTTYTNYVIVMHVLTSHNMKQIAHIHDTYCTHASCECINTRYKLQCANTEYLLCKLSQLYCAVSYARRRQCMKTRVTWIYGLGFVIFLGEFFYWCRLKST